jgi:hypothetical protein
VERTVPTTESEEVELYLRTYYSLLRSTAVVKIRTIEEAHAGMNSLLHPAARDLKPDMSAFIYSLLRLPVCMPQVRLVVLGQSTQTFSSAGFGDVETWEPVSSPARRRRCFFDGIDTLVCYIASRSDIDDILPLMTAYQIEWNKLHSLARSLPSSFFEHEFGRVGAVLHNLAETLLISDEDLERWIAVWGADFGPNLKRIAVAPCDLGVRLLSGSYREYRRATKSWWENIEAACPELRRRPVYFVSSNTHSLVNLISGFALQNQAELVNILDESENKGLLREWQDIHAQKVPSSKENFLYYILKKYLQSAPPRKAQALAQQQVSLEKELGILRVPSRHNFDVEAQVIDLARIRLDQIDPRLGREIFGGADGAVQQILDRSNALILNIDYPLGLAAYNILTEVAESVFSVLGIYVMGKAATLNAVVGDVMISNVVHDEHSRNTYLFPNCFTASDIAPYLVFGTVLDNQKISCVQGTFLQNADYMDVFYREGYSVIEMESGPYLSAAFEMHRPVRHPVNEIVNLYGVPFDIGIAHYASDKPLSKGRNLGAGSLSYFGMDSTYAVSVAILRRIFQREKQRLLE